MAIGGVGANGVNSIGPVAKAYTKQLETAGDLKKIPVKENHGDTVTISDAAKRAASTAQNNQKKSSE